MRFGELKKGDVFRFQNEVLIKTKRIKDGKDGAFYTCCSILTGNHYKITDDTEVEANDN